MPQTFYSHSEEYDTASGPFATFSEAVESSTPDVFTSIFTVEEDGKISAVHSYDVEDDVFDEADSPYEGMNIDSF